ncbi:hypothetical protein AB0C04_28130 [Micromonospora sp. NPDC048909]|uniref:hypothetical protein n=1 Tax=Micromonospora sp. NPDC048909 TaxID=3155643 RepID=UPI0033DD8C9C
MRFDLGDVPAWAAIIVSSAAILVALRANRHAKDSAAASQDSAVSSRRSADAAERQATAAEQALPPPPQKVAWRFEYKSRQEYVLRNTGTEAAHDVEIDMNRIECMFHDEMPDDRVVPSGASVSLIMMATGSGSVPNELWVRWQGQPEWTPVPLG